MLHLHSFLTHDRTEEQLILFITNPSLGRGEAFNDSTRTNDLGANMVLLVLMSAMCCYHAFVKSCCLVLVVELGLTVIVVRVTSASVVRIVPSFLRRQFLILYTQHFLYINRLHISKLAMRNYGKTAETTDGKPS